MSEEKSPVLEHRANQLAKAGSPTIENRNTLPVREAVDYNTAEDVRFVNFLVAEKIKRIDSHMYERARYYWFNKPDVEKRLRSLGKRGWVEFWPNWDLRIWVRVCAKVAA